MKPFLNQPFLTRTKINIETVTLAVMIALPEAVGAMFV